MIGRGAAERNSGNQAQCVMRLPVEARGGHSCGGVRCCLLKSLSNFLPLFTASNVLQHDNIWLSEPIFRSKLAKSRNCKANMHTIAVGSGAARLGKVGSGKLLRREAIGSLESLEERLGTVGHGRTR